MKEIKFKSNKCINAKSGKFDISNFKNDRQKAFTLVEMLVSVGLFLVVMTIVLGAVLAIIDGNKKTQAINSVSNNISSAVESMIRDMKTGYKYRCNVAIEFPLSGSELAAGSPCDASAAIQNITFISTISGKPRPVQYVREVDATGRGTIVKFFCPANTPNPEVNCWNGTSYFRRLNVTSPDIDVTKMDFYVKVPTPNTDQSSIFAQIKGTASINKTSASDFTVQTFISQRLLNI